MFLPDTNVVSELRKAKAGNADVNVTAWASTVTCRLLFLCHDGILGSWNKIGFIGHWGKISMSEMERLYQIDQILASRMFIPRSELQERLGVSWATTASD